MCSRMQILLKFKNRLDSKINLLMKDQHHYEQMIFRVLLLKNFLILLKVLLNLDREPTDLNVIKMTRRI